MTHLSAAALALAIGLRHAFEPDHLMAVATMVTRARGAATAARLGLSWGLGHTVALLVLGSSLVVARRTLPGPWETLFEALVGVMIVGLGVRRMVEAVRPGPRRQAPDAPAPGAGTPTPIRDELAHGDRRSLARGPLVVGLVHGVAGSGALTALAVASLPTVVEQVGFMAVFGVGSTVGMAGVAALAGQPLTLLARAPHVARWLSALTGVAAIAFGAAWSAPLVTTLLR